jgi:threonine-phosphate decarboxylase
MADEFVPLHGGQLREIARRFHVPEESLLDFSASISPMTVSEARVDALCELLRHRKLIAQYPDSEYPDLKQAIAQYAGVDPASICVANGVMPLLDAALRSLNLRRCLVLVPAFAEYQRILRVCAVERRTLVLLHQENFVVDPDAVLREVRRYSADSVLLANPHSPSGCLTPAGLLTQLQSALSALGVTTILDEAFVDYSPEASLSGRAANVDDVIAFRSITKFFAMPGLRVGYAVALPANCLKLESVLPLWPVDSIASLAARIALLDTALVSKTREANARERRWLSEQLNALGLTAFPSTANHLLVRLPDEVDGFDTWRRLIIEHLIVVRNCATFEGLSAQYLRIAIRDHAANQTLISAFACVL